MYIFPMIVYPYFALLRFSIRINNILIVSFNSVI
jgi:hypothetical protein